ncbi:MAG: bifunctional oligoribonuclease/PAP phosphatase NrnA [Desulfocapsaceae bacterium]|jgi:phosphoesterase RecJ-like protein|nr:bifunctional oligoribonuclease/PAP phosphatase NrnA [Desulfocapsaceae bacterium]
MSEKIIPDEILQIIAEKDNFVLLTHVHPDGDALGSLLGLADILDGLGKRVFAYLDEPVSHIYDFLPGCSRVSNSLGELHQFLDEAGPDIAAIALDCGEADRLGETKNRLLKIEPFIAVDHHLSHRNYGDYRWIDPGRSSTGEMVYEICEALEHTPSYNCAFALYVAIVTDTGSFKYECTRSRTLEIAGRLLERGVKPEKVASYLYDNFTPQRFKLMEMVLGTLELHEKDTIALIHVTRDMFEKSGAVVQDVEGFVDYPRSLQSVKFAIFLKEGKDDVVSVSLRGKGDCDVAAIAKHFGGGGHRNAAGCRFTGVSIKEVRKNLLEYCHSLIAKSS